VKDLGDAVEQLPDDRAEMIEDMLEAEDVPLFTDEEMRRTRTEDRD